MKQNNQTNHQNSNTQPKPAEQKTGAPFSAAELWWTGAVFVASSVGLALLLSNGFGATVTTALALALAILSVVAQTRLIRSFAGTLGHFFLILMLALFLGSPYLAGLFGATVSACCSFCFFCRKGGGAYAPALAILSYGLSAVILFDPLRAALSLLSLPLACALLLCLRGGVARIPAICRLTGTVLAVAIPAGALILRRHLGSLSAEAIRLFLDRVRLGATDALTDALLSTGSTLGLSVDAASYAETMVTALFNVLPALTVILAMLLAYAVHSAALRCLIGQGEEKETVGKMLSFDMSLVSAILYFLALLLSFLLVGERTALLGAVAQNVYLILVPGMLMTAWIAMNALLFARAPSCLSTLIYLGVIFLIVNLPAIMLPIASAFGAGVVILGRIRLRLNQKNS